MLRTLVKALSKLSRNIVKSARRLTGRSDVNADLTREVMLVVNSQRDSKVCQFCRSMDGRKMKMPLLGSRNFMFEYGNLEKTSGWGGQNLLPPFHPNCRCEVEVSD